LHIRGLALYYYFIPMEKLLELMNDYAHTYTDHYDDTGEEITITFFSHTDNCFQYVCDGGYETLVDDTVISKRFGFIKRLVDNDKINKRKIDTRLVRYVENHYDEDWYWVESSYEDYPYTDTLLMLLAIQDEPIQFLIKILKQETHQP